MNQYRTSNNVTFILYDTKKTEAIANELKATFDKKATLIPINIEEIHEPDFVNRLKQSDFYFVVVLLENAHDTEQLLAFSDSYKTVFKDACFPDSILLLPNHKELNELKVLSERIYPLRILQCPLNKEPNSIQTLKKHAFNLIDVLYMYFGGMIGYDPRDIKFVFRQMNILSITKISGKINSKDLHQKTQDVLKKQSLESLAGLNIGIKTKDSDFSLEAYQKITDTVSEIIIDNLTHNTEVFYGTCFTEADEDHGVSILLSYDLNNKNTNK